MVLLATKHEPYLPLFRSRTAPPPINGIHREMGRLSWPSHPSTNCDQRTSTSLMWSPDDKWVTFPVSCSSLSLWYWCCAAVQWIGSLVSAKHRKTYLTISRTPCHTHTLWSGFMYSSQQLTRPNGKNARKQQQIHFLMWVHTASQKWTPHMFMINPITLDKYQ